MEENSDKDKPFNLERWREAIVRAITSYNEKVITGKETTFQNTFHTQSLLHAFDGSATERQKGKNKILLFATVLEQWMSCVVSQLQSIAQPVKIDSQSPTLGLFREMVIILRPTLNSLKDIVEDTREKCETCQGQYNRARGIAENYRKQCEDDEEELQKFQEACDILQEISEQTRIDNGFLQENGKVTLDEYEESRDTIGRLEQRIEKMFSKLSQWKQQMEDISYELRQQEQVIEDFLGVLREQEEALEGSFSLLRQFEASIDRIMA
jgi:predicted nuclease with TOPRIM domain